MRTNVEELFGKEISAQVDDFYGLDAEGELKGAFKPTGRKFFFASSHASDSVTIINISQLTRNRSRALVYGRSNRP